MAKDYIPQNATQFDLFVQNLLRYIKNKQSNSKPWAIIPQEPIDNMYKLHTVFSEALMRAKNTPAPAYTKERNRTQAELTKAIRAFVNQFMRFDPVTDLDRDIMRILNRNTIRTSRTDITEVIGFDLKTKGIRQNFVAFKQLGASSTAKPRVYDGAVVVWHIGKERPNSPNDFRYHAVASRTHFITILKKAKEDKQSGLLCVGKMDAVSVANGVRTKVR